MVVSYELRGGEKMLWYVDACRDNVDFTSFDLGKGEIKHFSLFSEKTNFNIMPYILIVNILRNKPSQIIFDKSGIGLAFYDQFLEHLKDIPQVTMKSNGELIYN